MSNPETNLSLAAQDDEEKLSRMDLLSSAYGFISSREWPDGYGVHDVLSVARFLETGDED
nr:hypothetical protein OG513_07715 [Streptomyces sp. NBC_00998]